jgi:hypothetical protein
MMLWYSLKPFTSEGNQHRQDMPNRTLSLKKTWVCESQQAIHCLSLFTRSREGILSTSGPSPLRRLAPFAVDADQRPKLRAEVREKLSDFAWRWDGRTPAPVSRQLVTIKV